VAAAFDCEVLKVSRSKILWITMLVFLAIPLVSGFFMFILKNPALAHSYGLIGAKAQLAGTADWPSYLQFLAEGVSAGGLFVFGFITSWVFGREYSDRTVKDLLALPVPRTLVVTAKFLTVFLWCLLLVLLALLLGLGMGWLVVLPGWSPGLAIQGIETFAICSVLAILLSAPVAFMASAGRGYLSPLGFLVIALFLANIAGATGYGLFFPWAIPVLRSQFVSSRATLPGGFSYLLVVLTSIAGLLGTAWWWRYADQA
jgi:ABC-2 type transport system permease protein